MSISSHKIGGPMGVGALIVRDGLQLPSLIRGGGQERRRRAGTENVAAIAGFGAAAEIVRTTRLDEQARLERLRDNVEVAMLRDIPGARVVGANARRLANTCCIALPGRMAETTVIKLDLAGVAVSAGSACSSGKVGASHVLTAMGLPVELARSAIRVSLGWNTDESSLEQFLSRFGRLLAADGGDRVRAVA
jgi:cysteine desulfurase